MLENNSQLLANVLLGERTKPAARLGGKGKIHVVIAGIFCASDRSCAAKISARYHRHAVDYVPAFALRLARVRRRAFSLYELGIRRQNASVRGHGSRFWRGWGRIVDQMGVQRPA